MEHRVETVVIVGGGTAGWITAALLIKVLGKVLRIRLVESEEIGIVGVGEATIPPILTLNRALGIDETDFLKETRGTIKLGIQFENWSRPGDSFMHAFGAIGKDFPFASFHHFWIRGQLEGRQDSFWDYSLGYQAAKRNRFARLDRIDAGRLQGLVYAYHFDASLYAAYLRRFSEQLGVERIEGRIESTRLDGATGSIESVKLADGRTVAGDLFVDCSGFRGLLIGRELDVGYEDWSHWLPCDRAAAIPCESVEPLTPYTRSIAHGAGWQWRIPLRHRIGNGLVYSSRHLSDDEAVARLLDNLDGAATGEPRLLRFRTGRRDRQWHRNCVSIGLASGFLEPLESTSIHMIQSGVIRLIKHFPHAGFNQSEIDEYNRQARTEWEYIRDFIILHYHLNHREDTDFWRDCREMQVPDSLARRMSLFRETGKVFREQDELFSEVAWQQVMIGQGLVPRDYHPLVDALSRRELDEFLDSVRAIVDEAVSALPDHAAYLTALPSGQTSATR